MVEPPSPRTVLMTADTVGGVWSYALGLAAALNERGVHVVLATMGEPMRREQRAAARRLKSLEVFESHFKLEWMDDPWDDVERAGEWLLDLERSLDPDVVHLNGYAHARLPFRAPTIVVAHSCVLSWWRAVLGEEAPARYGRYRLEVAAGLARASHVVAPSEAMLRAIGDHYGAPPRARVIPNAVDARRFRPWRKEEMIFAAGRVWDPAKNIAALDAAAPEVPWPIVVAGSDASPDGRRQAPKSIRALGWIDEERVAEWMGRASIYALPARYEPFGLSVLEAALSGCALVLGDIASLREIWGDAAIYVPPNDTQALAEALTMLARDERLRGTLGVRAHTRALAYSPERTSAAYLALYREACGEIQPMEARPCA